MVGDWEEFVRIYVGGLWGPAVDVLRDGSGYKACGEGRGELSGCCRC